MRTCSNGSRCISKASSLTADNFRKASSGNRSNQFFKLCNYCRKRPPCLLTEENPHLLKDRCSSCQQIRSSQDFLDSEGIVILFHSYLMTGQRIDTCRFCQVNVSNPIHRSSPPEVLRTVSNRRPAPVSPVSSPNYTPRSQRVRSRRRIIRSPRPQRNRAPPRHFDSSPDLDEPRRCERRDHDAERFPTVRRDFIDEHGRIYTICNRCRDVVEMQRIARDLSSFSVLSDDEVNDDNDRNGPLPVWRLNLPSSQLDFSKSELWNDRTQRIVNGFRSNLDLCRLWICTTCNRFQPDRLFSSDNIERECGLCKDKPTPRFGSANNMDPGEVSNIEKKLKSVF